MGVWQSNLALLSILILAPSAAGDIDPLVSLDLYVFSKSYTE